VGKGTLDEEVLEYRFLRQESVDPTFVTKKAVGQVLTGKETDSRAHDIDPRMLLQKSDLTGEALRMAKVIRVHPS
jgi:hypothetical protein